jgi:hypothetical protein
MILIGVVGSCEQIAARNYVYESVRLAMMDRWAGCGESVKWSPFGKKIEKFPNIFTRADRLPVSLQYAAVGDAEKRFKYSKNSTGMPIDLK